MADGAQPRARDGWDDPIPLSALQHALYCLRQCALIHLDRAWVENRRTAEGRVLHQTVDLPGQGRRRGVRTVTGLPIANRRLGIAGVADVVEFRAIHDGAEVAFPVEYKRGKPKLHRADEVQLCAQALCLEEMTGASVLEGALFYGETRRRVGVPFDAGLRRLTEETIASVRALFASGCLPPAAYEARKCRGCSLMEICRPRLSGRSARAWRERAIAAALTAEPAADDMP
jgi:CRISPR-associated exonuclease Cas4